jgi:hypothetical protein
MDKVNQDRTKQQYGFEAGKMSRRAALRKAGVTSLLSVVGLVSADDLARLVIDKLRENAALRDMTNGIAADLRRAGVAFADTDDYCTGVLESFCTDDGPCANGGPCLGCTNRTNVDCADCTEAADWKFCNCQQAAINQYPSCVDCSGYPTGAPECAAFGALIAACAVQHTQDVQNCG